MSMNPTQLAKAVAMAIAGTTLSAATVSDAFAATTMYNTWNAGAAPGYAAGADPNTTSPTNPTDGWTFSNGTLDGYREILPSTTPKTYEADPSATRQTWVGTGGGATPFGYGGYAALNWAVNLTSGSDGGTISSADSLSRYGIAADIDTAQGAWQDSAGPRGWRHAVDIGLIRSDVTTTIRLTPSTTSSTFASLFGLSIYEGMDGSSAKWSHHGAWNVGYLAGDTSSTNLATINGNNPIGTSGLTFMTFMDGSGSGPHGGSYVEFTAQAGKIYSVVLGGRAGDAWHSPQAGYSLSVQAVPVPAAVWLFGSALTGLGIAGRRKRLSPA